MQADSSSAVLFLTPYGALDPSSRMRVWVYRRMLQNYGIYPVMRSFASDALFRYVYENRLGAALPALALAMLRRPLDLTDLNRFRTVVVHREVLPFGPPVLERFVRYGSTRLVLDLDDATYQSVPHVKRWFARMKGTSRVKSLIDRADLVLAGSRSLVAAVSSMGARRVLYLPTGIDIRRYRDAGPSAWERAPDGPFCLGWIGTKDTVHYLVQIADEICALAKRCDIVLKIIGGKPLSIPGVRVEWQPWSWESEAANVRSFHIGLYPLADTPWERAKCGYKALQYMAAGVPVAANNVGMLPEMITDGVHGVLITRAGEWAEKVAVLIKDSSLRKRMIIEAGKRVRQSFSCEVVCEQLAQALNSL